MNEMSNKVGRPVKFTREALKVEREKILAHLLDGKTLDQIFPLMGYGTRGAMCYHHPRVLRNALIKRKRTTAPTAETAPDIIP